MINKALKASLICIAAVAAVSVIGSMVVSCVAKHQIQSALAGVSGTRIDIGKVRFSC